MPQKKTQSRWWWQLLTVEALFFCCVFFWILGDLWYDEVLSWNVVFQHDSPWSIFRDYRFANNHFLSNFLEWLWLRGLNWNAGSEFLVRVPPLLFGMGTIAVVCLSWRKFLGERVAILAALVMACSPVFTAFAWQFRGYSLAMFLSALAVTATASRWTKPTWGNGFALFCVSLLLPLVMPSAAMLPFALAFALFAGKGKALRQWTGFGAAIRGAWPPVAGVFLGVAYYLTLREEFQRAMRESGGWTSAWMVGLHVVFAFALHLGVLCVPILKPAQRRAGTEPAGTEHPAHEDPRKNARAQDGACAEPAGTEHPAQEGAEPRLAWWLLSGCALALVAVLLVPSPVHRSPFPRVFLPLLPAVTFGAAVLARQWAWLNQLSRRGWRGLLASVFIFALAVRQGSEWLTARQLDTASEPPQNLLQQYYRGNCGVSALLHDYADLPSEQLKRQLLLVSPYDVPTFMVCQALAKAVFS